MRTFVGLLTLLMLAVVVTAQDQPSKVTLSVYGQSSVTAVNELAENLKLHASYTGLEEADLTEPCVVTAKDISGQDAAALVSFATGYRVTLDAENGVLDVGLMDTPSGGGQVKGYDVSVLGGMYVDYVNTWGAPAKVTPGEEPERETTSAKHLASLIDDVLYDAWSEQPSASVVGDRVLYTLHDSGHARVRELLDLLMKENGGESKALLGERKVIETLKATKMDAEYEATPISSVLAGICLEAGVGLALGPDIAALTVDHHVDTSLQDETAWDALKRTLALLDEDGIEVGVRAGAVAIEMDTNRISTGYHVYDIGNLLKKLDASYQRQRTAQGKDGGYTGGLREEGGNEVVLDSMYDLLEAAGRFADCYVYGTRLIVRGNAESVDAATEILVQMGWEKPKD